MDSAISFIFDAVVYLLRLSAKVSGLTYNELNIVLYFFLIPLLWCWQIDRILGKYFCTIGYILMSMLVYWNIPDFSSFSDGLFDGCVAFLNAFAPSGLNYVRINVVICVAVPIFLTVVLELMRQKVVKASYKAGN